MGRKFKCVKSSGNGITVGEVYELTEEGSVILDDGFVITKHHRENAIEWLENDSPEFRKFEEVFDDMEKFTLNDLKTGHVVKFRNGKYGLVLRDTGCKDGKDIIVYEDNNAKELERYNDDMTSRYSWLNEFSIMEVYAPYCYPDIHSLGSDCTYDNLVWKREEKRKMTVAEICEALGYDVEVVKG